MSGANFKLLQGQVSLLDAQAQESRQKQPARPGDYVGSCMERVLSRVLYMCMHGTLWKPQTDGLLSPKRHSRLSRLFKRCHELLLALDHSCGGMPAAEGISTLALHIDEGQFGASSRGLSTLERFNSSISKAAWIFLIG